MAFASIAWFVHQKASSGDGGQIRASTPLALDGTPSTAAKKAQVAKAPLPAPPLPTWRQALDLRAAKVLTASPATIEPSAQGKAARKKKKPTLPAPKALVQELDNGERLRLTLDPELQRQSLELFAQKELPYAAAVLLDLRDNSVLVMAGHSSANPKANPLEVATTPWSPAASTFKTITAAALVEKGAARPNTRVCFHGGLSGITDALLDDNPKLDKRCVDLTDAVAHSHNVVIAKLALKNLSKKDITQAAHNFLFEQDIPFEFPIEPSPVNFPDAKKARAKVAAGFWHIDLSAIHGAIIASIFARQGLYQPPHMVAERLSPEGEHIWPELTRPERKLSAKSAKKVGEMMVHTTTRGTARRSFRSRRGSLTPGVVVAGKTGALTGKRPPNYNYNWLIGFAPAQKPEVAFAVVLANPPKWRIKAHYAASKLIQAYWARRREIQNRPVLALSQDGLEIHQSRPAGKEQGLKKLLATPLRPASHAEDVAPLPGSQAKKARRLAPAASLSQAP